MCMTYIILNLYKKKPLSLIRSSNPEPYEWGPLSYLLSLIPRVPQTALISGECLTEGVVILICARAVGARGSVSSCNVPNRRL